MTLPVILDVEFDQTNGFFQVIPLDENGRSISLVQSINLQTGEAIRLKQRENGRVYWENGHAIEETIFVHSIGIVFHPNGDYRQGNNQGFNTNHTFDPTRRVRDQPDAYVYQFVEQTVLREDLGQEEILLD